MAPNQVLDVIRSQLITSGRDTRYKLNAYEFVLSGLEFYITQLGEKRHVTGMELSFGLLMFAHKQFGPIGRTVLRNWGINVTDDFGYIVYNLISLGIMGKQPEDRLDDFFNVTDLDQYFEQQDPFEIDKNFIKNIKGA